MMTAATNAYCPLEVVGGLREEALRHDFNISEWGSLSAALADWRKIRKDVSGCVAARPTKKGNALRREWWGKGCLDDEEDEKTKGYLEGSGQHGHEVVKNWQLTTLLSQPDTTRLLTNQLLK